ncbi:hypothetical protein N7540_009347 [Penicillium herquei]|nr:hypothetical protein N7540_009347 [Penicillium herquei]
MDAQITSSKKKPSPEKTETANATDEKHEEGQKTNQQEVVGSDLSTPSKSIAGRTPRPEWRTPPNKVRLSSRTPPPAPRSQSSALRDDSWYGPYACTRTATSLTPGRRPLAGTRTSLTKLQDEEALQKLLEFDPSEVLQAQSLKRKREESQTPTTQGTKNEQAR